MKKVVLLIICFILLSCGKSSFKITDQPDWNDLKTSIIIGASQKLSDQMGIFSEITKQIEPELTQYILPSDRERLENSISTIGDDFRRSIEGISRILDPQKDDLLFKAREVLGVWSLNRLVKRVDKVSMAMRLQNPFEQINIQVDPTLPPSLVRSRVSGNACELFIPLSVGEEVFDQGYIVALIKWTLGDEKLDWTAVQQFCMQNNSKLPTEDQLFTDLAFSLSTWLTDIEPDLRTWTLRSSIKYDHIFSPQFAYGELSKSTETTLKDVVKSAVTDASSPLFRKFFDKLKHPGKLGLAIKQFQDVLTVEGVTPGGPAEVAGILPGDIIKELNNRPTLQAWQLENIIWDCDSNQMVILRVIREKSKGATGAVLADQVSTNPNLVLLSYQIQLNSNVLSQY